MLLSVSLAAVAARGPKFRANWSRVRPASSSVLFRKAFASSGGMPSARAKRMALTAAATPAARPSPGPSVNSVSIGCVATIDGSGTGRVRHPHGSACARLFPSIGRATSSLAVDVKSAGGSTDPLAARAIISRSVFMAKVIGPNANTVTGNR